MPAPCRSTPLLAGFLLTVLTLPPVLRADKPAVKDARGNSDPANVPLPKPLWRQSLLRYPNHGDTARWLQAAEEALRRQGEPVPVPFSPVVATVSRRVGDSQEGKRVTLVLYRSHWGIHAVDMETGKLDWETPSKWSLDGMTAPSSGGGKQQAIQNWMTFYLQLDQRPGVARPAVVFENSSVGTLTNDEKLLYAVEDFEVLPPAVPYGTDFGGRFPRQAPSYYSPEVNDAVQHSRLHAFEIRTGKLKWEAGDPSYTNGLEHLLFLGPPLPAGGKLYGLALTRGGAYQFVCPCLALPTARPFWELQLLCIEPATFHPRTEAAAFYPKLVSRHPLAVLAEPMPASGRRMRAARLAATGDTLLCLTDAGVLAGFDLQGDKPAWSYRYRETANDRPAPNGAARQEPSPWWGSSSLTVRGDRAVFTAADWRAVHCLSLRDHSPIWKEPRAGDDVYLAGVFADTVVIVGKRKIRGLRVDTGKKAWEVATGLPSGQGSFRDGKYYLPLQDDAAGKKPARIIAVDVAAGRVAAVYTLPARQAAGNLFFFGDRLVSQTNREIAVYPLPDNTHGK